MKKINYKSDFDAVLKLRDGRGKEIPFPDCDWEAIFWTFSKSRVFRASCIGGECVNCIRENDGRFRVVFNGHGIGVGILKWEPHFKLPDTLFPDGVRNIYVPMPLDIELVTGAGDNPTTAEVEASLPLIKGDKGDRGDRGEKGEKGDGFTPAQIAKLDALPEAEALNADIDDAARRGFVDLWNAACGEWGGFNPETELFELNGLTDMSYREALEIYNFSSPGLLGASTREHVFFRSKLRTMLPIYEANVQKNWKQAFFGSPNLEVVSFSPGAANVVDGRQMFSYCPKLKRILPGVNAENCNATGMFEYCYALEEAKLMNIKNSVSFAWSPFLSLESLEYIIDNRPTYFTNAITITVHPDVYAKLTGDTSNAAAAALTAEELAAWQQIVADAAAKNISFATV